MKADRRRLWFVIGLAGLVVASACGSGDGSNGAGGTSPDQGPTTTAAAPVETVTTGPSQPPTTVASREPVYRDGVPQVTASPTRAPAGTRVRLDGYGFTGDPWQDGGGYLALSDPRDLGECVVFAEADHDLTVTPDGHLSGSFVVPAKGVCRHSTGEVHLGAGGRYDIELRCATCRIGTFTVILPGESMEEPTGMRCGEMTVNFSVQNFASDIYADGVTCGEAQFFLRDHARPLQPPADAAHFDADGFSCDRTGRSDAALPPRANYKCTRGAQYIYFIRQ